MSTQAAAVLHSRLDVASDHPAFAGHFPKFPVLPGAALLDEALQLIERERGIDLTQWHIAAVKFLDAVRPGDALGLEHDMPEKGLIRFTIRCDGRTVASGSLTLRDA
jgi:3-hydroxyacyl-[acyl-carrier-protein] dehydratase